MTCTLSYSGSHCCTVYSNTISSPDLLFVVMETLKNIIHHNNINTVEQIRLVANVIMNQFNSVGHFELLNCLLLQAMKELVHFYSNQFACRRIQVSLHARGTNYQHHCQARFSPHSTAEADRDRSITVTQSHY